MVENELPIGAPLLNILVEEDQTFTGKELCFERVRFVFTTQSITIEAISDTDEIKILQSSTTEGLESDPPEWARSLIGEKLQTLWTCENAQGYFDQVILAFGQLQPTLAFVAEGAVLKAFQSQPLYKKVRSSARVLLETSIIQSAAEYLTQKTPQNNS